MSFFEPPPPPPEPLQAMAPKPEWLGPPENAVPASFRLDVTLARTDALALFISSGRAYEHGFEFTLSVRQRKPPEQNGHDPMLLWHPGRRRGFDDSLRFGIAFADGRKATIFDQRPWWVDSENQPPPSIVLMQRGGGGGGKSWNFDFWAWPLPPDGPIAFVAEWPVQGIELSRTEVDSTVVREAAGRAVTLWPDEQPDDGPGGAGLWTHFSK